MFKCKTCGKKFKEAQSFLIQGQSMIGCSHCQSLDFEACGEFEKMYHRKIVRDKVLVNLKKQNIRYEASKITDLKQMHSLLLESLENLQIDLKKGFSSEILADMIEHIIAIGGINKLAWEDIMQVRRKKLEKYGAYQMGTYLLWTESKDEKN